MLYSPAPSTALLASVLQAASYRAGRKLLGRLLGVHGSAHRLPQDPHESQYHSPRPKAPAARVRSTTLLRRRQIAVQPELPQPSPRHGIASSAPDANADPSS